MKDFAFPTLHPDGEIVTVGNTAADRAAHIVAEAQAEADRIIGQAGGIGYEEGYTRGLEEARTRLAPAAAALGEALTRLEAAFAERETASERRAVELGLAIAEKILAASLDIQPELVLSVVGGTLRAISARDGLAIDVNPEDFDLVRDAIDERIEVVPERRVGRGGCVVRTSEGELDARVGEQLARVEETLREAFAHRAVDTAGSADG